MERSTPREPDAQSSKLLADLQSRHGPNMVADYLVRRGIPLTRENYIDLNWMDGAPDPSEMDPDEQAFIADLPSDTEDLAPDTEDLAPDTAAVRMRAPSRGLLTDE